MRIKCACGCHETTPASEISDWLPVYQIGLRGRFKVLYFWNGECLAEWSRKEALKSASRIIENIKNSLVNIKPE